MLNENEGQAQQMVYPDLKSFLAKGRAELAKGPTALILLEDTIEVDSTLRHHLELGFAKVVAFGASDIPLAADVADQVIHVHHDMRSDKALETVVNGAIHLCPEQWLFYCYNAEYLFFPFCEHRKVGEMLTFQTEERRSAILTYVIDLYAGDLDTAVDAVSLENAHLDTSGYYALARTDRDNTFLERQLDFYGGLRWRFEEHVPWLRRRIDRISLFKAAPKLNLRADHTLNEPEYNTYACPWHHSITASICSFRTAKALKRNPGSGYQIPTFKWHNSAAFAWNSQQLMDLGLMEPGQWF